MLGKTITNFYTESKKEYVQKYKINEHQFSTLKHNLSGNNDFLKKKHYRSENSINKIYDESGKELNTSINSQDTMQPPLTLSAKTQSVISQILWKKQPLTQTVNSQKYQSKPLKEDMLNSNKKQSEPLTISKKTLEMISKLKEERKNRFEREKWKKSSSTLINSAISLRFKYKDLISSERQLPLPIKYNQLLSSFIALDKLININKKMGQGQLNFDKISQSIESSSSHSFTISTFSKILYIVPHFYIVKWIKCKEKDDFVLVIDIPKDVDQFKNIYSEDGQVNSNSLLEIQNKYEPLLHPMTNEILLQREEIFKGTLYQLVNLEHQKFIENKTEKFNPFIQKTWHHEFDLENVKEIPEFTIQPKPIIDNCFERCIKLNELKSLFFDKEVQMSGKDEEVFKTINSKIEDQSKVLSKFVSESFLKKLQKKELTLHITNKIISESGENHTKISREDNYKELINQIQNCFICLGKSSIELNVLIDKLLKSSVLIQLNYKRENLLNDLRKISSNFPNWIKIINHSSLGHLVVIEENVNIYQDIILNIKSLLN